MHLTHEKVVLSKRPEFADAASAEDLIAVFADDHQFLGGAALWWSDVPAMDGETPGCIGAFRASSETVCHQLLARAEEILRSRGITRVIGPMNGNTWRSYRWVTESNGRAPFVLEPCNDRSEQPDWWVSRGYTILSRYSSSIVPLDGTQVTDVRIRQRLVEAGVMLTSLDLERFEEDLRAIYDLSVLSFSQNFLYTPMDWPSFLKQYEKVKAWLRPDYVILARCDGRTVGFVFAFPDVLAMARGESPALIVKTLAALPDRRFAGLGNWLVDECHIRAWRDGFRESIHALQYDDNSSRKITARFGGQVFRRYALFTKSLA